MSFKPSAGLDACFRDALRAMMHHEKGDLFISFILDHSQDDECRRILKTFDCHDLMRVVRITCPAFSLSRYYDDKYLDKFEKHTFRCPIDEKYRSAGAKALEIVVNCIKDEVFNSMLELRDFDDLFDRLKPSFISDGCLEVLVRPGHDDGFNIDFETEGCGSLLSRSFLNCAFVQRLLELGADPNTCITWDGRVPILKLACCRRNPLISVAELLLDHPRMRNIMSASGEPIEDDLDEHCSKEDRQKIRRLFARFRMRIFTRAQISPSSPAREFCTDRFLMTYVARLLWSSDVSLAP